MRKRRHAWSAADTRRLHGLLRRGYSTVEAAPIMGFSRSAVLRNAKETGLTNKFPGCFSRRWSHAEKEILRAKYPNTSTKAIAKKLRRPLYQVYQAAARLGLEKTAEYMASPAACRMRRGDHVGRKFWFPKGHVPANKGLRRPGWAPGRMAETQFKPGVKPKTWLPIGSLRIVYGNLERKIADRPGPPTMRWRPVHRIVWEAAHGPVPPGHVVVFRPARHTTVENEITLDRLELVTRAELMRRNSYHTNYPPEIGLLIQARGALIRQINQKERMHAQN